MLFSGGAGAVGVALGAGALSARGEFPGSTGAGAGKFNGLSEGPSALPGFTGAEAAAFLKKDRSSNRMALSRQ
jgi:hypothetical protein